MTLINWKSYCEKVHNSEIYFTAFELWIHDYWVDIQDTHIFIVHCIQCMAAGVYAFTHMSAYFKPLGT